MAEPLDVDAVRERRAKAEKWYEGVHYGLKLYAVSSDDVPGLLAEVERLRAEVDRYRELHESLWPVLSAAHAMRALYAPKIGPQNESLFRPHELALIRAVDESTVGSVWVDGRLAEVVGGVWAERDAALKVVHAAADEIDHWRRCVETAGASPPPERLADAVDEWRAR